MEHEVELLLEWHSTKWSMSSLIHETSEAFESEHIKEKHFPSIPSISMQYQSDCQLKSPQCWNQQQELCDLCFIIINGFKD
jgi:hypothetical protein